MRSGSYLCETGKLLEDPLPLIKDNSALHTQAGGPSAGTLPGRAAGSERGEHCASVQSRGGREMASCQRLGSEGTAGCETRRTQNNGLMPLQGGG